MSSWFHDNDWTLVLVTGADNVPSPSSMGMTRL